MNNGNTQKLKLKIIEEPFFHLPRINGVIVSVPKFLDRLDANPATLCASSNDNLNTTHV